MAVIDYPSWYSPEFLEADALWSAALRIPLSVFFAQCSLHDCLWMGLTIGPRYDGEAVAAFQLGGFWYRKLVPALAEEPWGALLVRFDHVVAVRQDLPRSSEGMPRTISKESIRPSSAGATATIEDIYGGRVEIDYVEPVSILFLSWEGEALTTSLVGAS